MNVKKTALLFLFLIFVMNVFAQGAENALSDAVGFLFLIALETLLILLTLVFVLVFYSKKSDTIYVWAWLFTLASIPLIIKIKKVIELGDVKHDFIQLVIFFSVLTVLSAVLLIVLRVHNKKPPRNT